MQSLQLPEHEVGTMIKEAIKEDQKQYCKSCKRCLKVAVCQAYALAQATNEQFGSIQFLELKKPMIQRPDSLAESCKEYCPPDSKLFGPVTLAESTDLV